MNYRKWLIAAIALVFCAGAHPPCALSAVTATLPADRNAIDGRSPSADIPLADTTNLGLRNLELTQGVPNAPLVVGRQTAARVQIAAPAGATLDANVEIQVNGKSYRRSARITGPVVTVTVGIDPPREVAPVTAVATVRPAGNTVDANTSDDSLSRTFQTVRTVEKVVAFFLPVDWTPADRSQYDYNTAFQDYVLRVGGFLADTYPLPESQVLVAHTMTPHMLTSFEQTLADSQGKFNMRNALAMYASLSFAGRRYRPDATMVVGVLPPNWFRKHGQPGTVGFALSDVKGIVTGQYDTDLPPIIAAHEIGHLYWLDEDYDFAIKPARTCLPITTPGFWVRQDQELALAAPQKLCTFMSAASRDQFWIDGNIYDYLLAKFSMTGGTASAPMILAATMTYRIDDEGYPARVSANTRRFEPNQSVYVSIAGMALPAGATILAKLYRGDNLVKTSDPLTTTEGNRWYSLLLAGANTLAQVPYRVEIYLDGRLVKSNQFEVQTSR